MLSPKQIGTICFAIISIFSFSVSAHADDCGILNLDTSTGGTAYAYTMLNGKAGYNESTYGLTEGSGQWAVEFDYGVVYGMRNCNTTKGEYAVAASITPESDGQYCWCQATGFTPTSDDYSRGPQCTVSLVSSSWVYITGLSGCNYSCGYNCVINLLYELEVRQAVFGAAGQ